MRRKKTTEHVFAVCAYKESPYLEDCICSLKNQTIASSIVVVTSTPNEYIEKICDKNGVPLIINQGEGGIAQDWNFGYKNGKAHYVTIAHQDDIYEKNYTEEVLKQLKKRKQSIIAFTNYGEIRNGQKVENSKLLQIKKIMLLPLRLPVLGKTRLGKRMIISLGNPVCCPSVTYNKNILPMEIFHVHFRSNVDWETWETFSRLKGEFVYIPKILMYHRIHEGSETSAIIQDNQRSTEDYEMFRKFWPKTIAKILTKIYAKSEKSNFLDK